MPRVGEDPSVPSGARVYEDAWHPLTSSRNRSGGQETQAPRNVAKGRAAALTNARRLVNEAEVACKDADSARATSNARAAIELLKYLP